jgi:hypothetical protein
MITVTIYLRKEIEPLPLIQHLLEQELIIAASVDTNNLAYKIVDKKLISENNNVITAQTKALLFGEIADSVEQFIGEQTTIIANPIVFSNKFFENSIRTEIKAV